MYASFIACIDGRTRAALTGSREGKRLRHRQTA